MEHPEGDRGSLMARAASQSSLDESSQRAGGGDGAGSEPRSPTGDGGGGGGHAVHVLSALARLRRERVLCDVVLHARPPAPADLPEDDKGGSDSEAWVAAQAEAEAGTEAEAEAEADGGAGEAGDGVCAHRAVLAACSPYFRAMFSQWVERALSHITLREVEPSALEAIVQWMYCPESLLVTEDNVQALLAAASLLQCAGVRAKAAAFLQSALGPENALGIMSFAEMHSCGALAAAARNYVLRHFVQVSQHDEFLSLEPGALVALLQDDQLCCVPLGERAALDGALRWLQHAPARHTHMLQVVGAVRLALVPHEALVSAAQGGLRAAPAPVKDLLIGALSYHLCGLPPAPRPRRPPAAPRLLLVVGGQAPKAIRDVEAYDLESARWSVRRELLSRRCRCGLGALGGRVYAVGGFNGTLRVRGVDVYDPAADVWAPGPPLCARRSTLGVCALAGRLYAVGGFDGAAGLCSAEVLDPAEGAWRPVADMSTRRSSVGVCALDGHVYAVGGYDGAARQCLASVERYDPAADRWLPAPPMAARRSGAGVAALGGRLYAVGGHDGPAVRRSVERYCPRAAAWRPAPPMRTARRNAAVLAHGGRLYVVGGDDGAANLDTVEVFDPATDTWSELPQRMSVGRSYAGVALVERA